ncbi:MAG: hypothetical protein ACM3RX_10505 [Methanococcaceae archaeon]
MIIPIKLRVKGMIAILKEQLMFLFHFSDAARISIKHRSIKSPIITAFQYWGRLVVVATDSTPEETILEGITLGEIMVVNIKIPVSNNNLNLNI